MPDTVEPFGELMEVDSLPWNVTARLPPTHDTSHVPHHLRSLDDFAQQLNSAVLEAWDYRLRYKTVYAILLMWGDDDLNVASEVSMLEETLRVDYRYETAIWKIPSEKPGWEIKTKLIYFLREKDAPESLIIFYYGGHAMPNPQQPGGPPLWTSSVSLAYLPSVFVRIELEWDQN
jgi:hypothetical protein